jgi:hypothetical protein
MAKKKFSISPDAVLRGAREEGLARVLVIGVTTDGLFYSAASGDTETHLKDLEDFKSRIFQGRRWDAKPLEPA